MIALEETTAVLLCAGQSRRFGEADKLLHPLDGKPLAAHAAQMLASLPFALKLATVRPCATKLHALLSNAGFTLVPVPAGASQTDSLRHGLDIALDGDGSAILLALGDMPWVTAQHIKVLASAADTERPAASKAPDWTGPPWLAPAIWVRANIETVRAGLLRDAVPVAASAALMRDVDRPADLVPSQNR